MASLTRDSARDRAEAVSVDSYDLELDLTDGGATFGSRTTIRFRSLSGRRSTFVDVAARRLRAATLNGTALDIDRCFDPTQRRLELPTLESSNELVVDAVMAYSHDGEGLHRHVDPADGQTYLYAMSFLDAAPRWFACFDQPDLKAPMRLSVRCPVGWTVLGNGSASELEPGRWTITSTGPLATYFATLVAGPYHVLHDNHDGIALSLSVRRSLAEHLDRDAGHLFDHTKHCLDALHALFGVRYPWGDYHQAFVPEFNAGAMENPGCVTLRDQMIFRGQATAAERLDRDITIAHEMAHMWFGDLVTMRWWDDLWLNESFAEYLGQRVTGEHCWIGFGIRRKSWGYAADRRPSTHPVAGNGARDAAAALSEFDGISYAKGASVLRQLALHLGDDVFLAGLRHYIRDHAHGNARFSDLMSAWSAAGAVDLDRWARSWLRTTGLDELSAHEGTISRRSADGTGRVHAITAAGYGRDGRDGRELTSAPVTVSAAETAVPALAGAALVLPDARDETWAKIALGEHDWGAMVHVLPALADARARVSVWNALQLAVADGEVDPRVAADILVAALPAETEDVVVSVVGNWGVRLADCYLAPADAVQLRSRLCQAMLPITEQAPPGSSRQLAAARLAIATTTAAQRLQSWLDGDGLDGPDGGLPAGLALDTDLRWTILLRLAALGGVDAAAIDAEAARDHSSDGAVHAARCHAALPEPAEKQAAWEAIVADAGRPNYELYALAEGFWQPHQRPITEQYVSRYFAEIPTTARLRSGWVVGRVATLAYPWTAVEPATLAATERVLGEDGLDHHVRRSLVDAGDDLRRALAARQRFAAGSQPVR